MLGIRTLASLALTCCSCGYPDFAFAPPDAAPSDSAIVDSDAAIDGDTVVDGDVPHDGATTTDTGTIVDSGTAVVDSGSAMDTAPADTGGVGCAGSTSLFCDDFDDASTPTDHWGGGSAAGGGSMSLVTTGVSSPPKSLRTVYVASSAAESWASVGKTFDAPTATASMRIRARVFVESATYAEYGAVLIKVQTTGGHGVGLMVMSGGGFGMQVYGAAYDEYPLPSAALPIGKWIELRIDTALKASGGFYQVYVDGTLVASQSGLSTTLAEEVPREVVVGLYTNHPAAAYAVRYDDVHFDFF